MSLPVTPQYLYFALQDGCQVGRETLVHHHLGNLLPMDTSQQVTVIPRDKGASVAQHRQRRIILKKLVRTAVTDGDDLANFIDEVSDRDTFAVRWVPQYDPVDDAEFFCGEVFEETKARVTGATVLMDEAHLVFAPAAHTSPELGRVLRLGRHAGLNVLLVTPRLAEISRCATFQADWIICCGAISEPSDMKGLEERTSPEFRRTVEGLGMEARCGTRSNGANAK